jgi:hypothetical protein
MHALLTTVILALQAASAPPAVTYTDYSRQFDEFEARTTGLPPEPRVAEFRKTFDALAPGLYEAKDEARLHLRIRKALQDFPALRPAYQLVESRFPGALATAVTQFRRIFPDFVPPVPIYLMHSLGVRDGGTDYVNGRKVMMFGRMSLPGSTTMIPCNPSSPTSCFTWSTRVTSPTAISSGVHSGRRALRRSLPR